MKQLILRTLAIIAILSVSTYFAHSQVNLIDMAKGAYKTKNYQESANYLYQILQNEPANAEALLLYSDVYKAVEDYPQAASILSYALSKVKEPENRMNIRLNRIKMLNLLEIPESALNEATKLSAEYPKNTEILLALARCQCECSDTLAAIKTLQSARKLDKKSVDIQCRLAEVLTAKGSRSEAMKELDLLFAQYQKLPFNIDDQEGSHDFMNVNYTLLVNYPKLQEYRKTAQLITETFLKISLMPMESDSALLKIAFADELSSYVENNKERILNSNEGENKLKRLYAFIGALYSKIGDYPTALSYLNQCRDSEMPFEWHLSYACNDLFYCGHIDKIKNTINTKLQHVTETPKLSSQERLDNQHSLIATYAYYLAMEGLADETVNYCQEYGMTQGDAYLTTAYYLRGEYDKALEQLDQMEDQIDCYTLLARANILSLLNRSEEAKEALENVIILTDEETDLRPIVAYAALGDTVKATSLMNKYVNSSNYEGYIGEKFYLAAINIITHNEAAACRYIKDAMKSDPAEAFTRINQDLLLIVPPSFFSGKDFVSFKSELDNHRQQLFEQTDKYFK